jgi:cell wall-associated NlpC family hydrolase
MRAADLVGAPFEDRGRGPGGYDCWGLVCEAYRREGISLPDYTLCCHDAEGFHGFFEEELPRWTRHEPPDIPVPAVVTIRLNSPLVRHVGVYIGGGRFLHTREKTGAVIERIDAPQWRHRIEGFYTPGGEVE